MVKICFAQYPPPRKTNLYKENREFRVLAERQPHARDAQRSLAVNRIEWQATGDLNEAESAILTPTEF
jgi:hypothetical protein